MTTPNAQTINKKIHELFTAHYNLLKVDKGCGEVIAPVLKSMANLVGSATSKGSYSPDPVISTAHRRAMIESETVVQLNQPAITQSADLIKRTLDRTLALIKSNPTLRAQLMSMNIQDGARLQITDRFCVDLTFEASTISYSYEMIQGGSSSLSRELQTALEQVKAHMISNSDKIASSPVFKQVCIDLRQLHDLLPDGHRQNLVSPILSALEASMRNYLRNLQSEIGLNFGLGGVSSSSVQSSSTVSDDDLFN